MSSFTFDTIFTIDARTNLVLPVTTDHLNLNPKQVFHMVQQSFLELKTGLRQKGIDYANLKRALVPSTTREEWAFLFDWQKCEHYAYGREAMHSLLPLLNPHSTHSILCGDWPFQESFSKWVEASPELDFPSPLKQAAGDGETLYFIYVNNLSATSAQRIAKQLYNCESYLGALNLSNASLLKAGMARQLVRAFIKHRGYIIQSHEDDRPIDEDTNLSLLDFSKFGLHNRSVPGWLYGLFLSFKIESPSISGERDSVFSLNALSDKPVKLCDCTIELEEKKFQYLLEEKADSLKRAGLIGLTAADLKGQIHSKLNSNYIYNLARADDGQVLKFNIILEFAASVRSLVALEYIPAEYRMRVITFY